MEHGEVVAGPLLVPSGDPAERLEAVEEPLHSIARPVGAASIRFLDAALACRAGSGRPNPDRRRENRPQLSVALFFHDGRLDGPVHDFFLLQAGQNLAHTSVHRLELCCGNSLQVGVVAF